MPAAKAKITAEKEAFTQERMEILLNLIVAHVLNNRSAFYKHPDLLPVADHGGDRINKQIQNMLKAMVEKVAPGQPVVQNQLKIIKDSKGSGGAAGSSPKKRKLEDD